MSSTIGVQNIAHTNGTNAMTVDSGGVATFSNPPSGLGTINYVNNLTVSGTTVQTFDTNLSGSALNGGAKSLRIFFSGLNNTSNNYILFQILSEDGATDGGYGSSFAFRDGGTLSQNAGTDPNLATALGLGYWDATYTGVVECNLIDPSTNHWLISGKICGDLAVSGSSIGYNVLGANKPITGFRFKNGSANGFNITSLKYGYSYTI